MFCFDRRNHKTKNHLSSQASGLFTYACFSAQNFLSVFPDVLLKVANNWCRQSILITLVASHHLCIQHKCTGLCNSSTDIANLDFKIVCVKMNEKIDVGQSPLCCEVMGNVCGCRSHSLCSGDASPQSD